MAILKSELTYHKSNIALGNNIPKNQKDKILDILKSAPAVAIGGLITDNVSGEELSTENIYRSIADLEWCDSEIFHFEKYDAQLTEEAMQKLLRL